jgi:transcriptional regulator with XRE-family HTH domain
MLSPTQKSRALRAAKTCQALGITQSEIADAVGASQSQVSRILNAEGRRASRLFEEVCLYVERAGIGVTADAVRGNEELINALASTWDGSDAHARALSAVIRSLAILGPAGKDGSKSNS